MTVQLTVDDAGFVRAPVDLVYRRLTDVGAWPTWWPGLAIRSLPPDAGRERWGISLPVGPGRLLRYGAAFHGWRHEQGVLIDLAGDVTGTAEFWFEATPTGTVVHHLASLSSGIRWGRRALVGYRRGVRRGLWGLKDALQLEIRTSVGMLP